MSRGGAGGAGERGGEEVEGEQRRQSRPLLEFDVLFSKAKAKPQAHKALLAAARRLPAVHVGQLAAFNATMRPLSHQVCIAEELHTSTVRNRQWLGRVGVAHGSIGRRWRRLPRSIRIPCRPAVDGGVLLLYRPGRRQQLAHLRLQASHCTRKWNGRASYQPGALRGRPTRIAPPTPSRSLARCSSTTANSPQPHPCCVSVPRHQQEHHAAPSRHPAASRTPACAHRRAQKGAGSWKAALPWPS